MSHAETSESAATGRGRGNVRVDFVVKFGKETVSFTLPLTARMSDVKAQLATQTQVPPEKQRLLLNAPVDKDKRRDASDSCSLEELFPSAYVQKIINHASNPTTTMAQHIKLTAMLIGSSQVTPMVDSKAAAEISRLVATTVEHGGQWYRCSFGKGYLRQTAYVCRTCVSEGRADPNHAFCLACAEMCHGNHEVEEWGVRYCMRCDCCTKKCWNPPPEGYTRMPRLSDLQGSPAAEADTTQPVATASKVSVMTSDDVSSRFESRQKRSRSSSPLTPKRTTTGAGGSPVSGVRVAAVANAPSPFALQDPPSFETQAVTAPVSGAADVPAAPAGAAATAKSTNTAATGATPQRVSHREKEEDQPLTEKQTAAVAGTSAETATGVSTSFSPPWPGYQPPPEVDRCIFILDSRTGKPPTTAVLPANAKNRYPRDSLRWCYCKDDHPLDDPHYGGIVCILCTTCFWSNHVTRLHSEQYRRVPCYGDVVQGDTLAFKCVDCNTYVCAPCRLRCHRHHTIEPEFIIPSREDGSDNGAPLGVNFSCGCRGLCTIAESVPDEEVDDPSLYLPMPPDVANGLVDNDVFTGFVCAHCMQENPWLMTEDPRRCYHGELPPKVTGAAIKPVVKCGQKVAPSAEEEDDVFPWHGMILPVTSFTEDATCSCGPCRAAFEKFAPRATEDATEMVVQLHDECDNCGKSLKDQSAFMCQTCEMALDKAFMVCKECNELRLRLIQEKRRREQRAANEVNSGGAEGGTTGGEAPRTREQPPTTAEEGEARPYLHSLDHDFLEDTSENVYALAGMQMMQSMDSESLAYLQHNWDSVKDQIQISSTIVDAFGQIPLSFSNEELEAMAEENRRSSAGPTNRNGNSADDDPPAKKEKKE